MQSSLCLSLSDGARVVSGSRDMTLRIWNMTTGCNSLEPLKGHTNAVKSVSFSPDGVKCIWINTTKPSIWDAMSGDCVLGPLRAIQTMWFQCRFLLIVLALSLDLEIKLFAYGKYHQEHVFWVPLKGHAHYVNAVAFSPDGAKIVSGGGPRINPSAYGTGCLGNVCWALLRGHTEEVTTVSFSSNSQHIVSGSADKTIRVWDSSSGTCIIGPLEGHMESVTCVAFSPDDTRIVSGSRDKTIRFWIKAEGKYVNTTKQM